MKMTNHESLMAAFMRRIGLQETAEVGMNPMILDLQGLGQLTLATADKGEDFLMSLAVPLPPYERERLLAALRLCHPDRLPPFPLACGLCRDHLVFISRQAHVELTAATLENQAMFLIDNAKRLGF
jgi:type III secretion system chaperone SycN